MAKELRTKYGEILALRILHVSGAEDVSRVRGRMAALANRFPGALRETDELELGEIHRRIGRLDAVLRDSANEEPWMEAMANFHMLTRGVLAVKRWLDGRRTIDMAVEQAFATELELPGFPEEVRGWAGDLARVAAPPRGRMMDLVFARLAKQLGTTEREARQLVFGPRSKRPGGRS
jgi:hypothetical protein